MKLTPIKTRVFTPPQTSFYSAVDTAALPLSEQSVLVVTAKVVALHQGRTEEMKRDPKERQDQKDRLAIADAEWHLPRDRSVPHPRLFTVYEETLCSMSGIDASNGDGYWIRLPHKSSQFAAELRAQLCAQHQLRELGVMVIDSRSYPMRNGTLGVTIGYAGFAPLYDYRGQNDLFSTPFKAERINVADCLASAATLVMGEGNEGTPLCLIEDIPHINFAESTEEIDPYLKLKVPMAADVFAQFYTHQPWQPGGRNHEA